MAKPKYTFFSPDKKSAENYVKKITEDYHIQTGKHLQGTLATSKKQMKHSAGWKTWEY